MQLLFLSFPFVKANIHTHHLQKAEDNNLFCLRTAISAKKWGQKFLRSRMCIFKLQCSHNVRRVKKNFSGTKNGVFFTVGSWEKDTIFGAAQTNFRPFLFRQGFWKTAYVNGCGVNFLTWNSNIVWILTNTYSKMSNNCDKTGYIDIIIFL